MNKLLAFFLFAAATAGAEDFGLRASVPARADEASSFERNGEKVRKLHIANGMGSYTIGLSSGQSPPSTRIGLPQEPHFHNFPPWDFLEVRINGIPLKDLKPLSVTRKEESSRAGWELVFNFNGIRLGLYFFMRPASPVLWCRGILQPLEDAVLESAELTIICFPGIMLSGRFLSDEYDRTVFTPSRVLDLKDQARSLPLTPEDEIVIFSDRKHPAPDGYGPCAIVLEWEGLDSGEVLAGRQCYVAKTNLRLSRNARLFTFGVFKSGKKFSDREFLEFSKTFRNDSLMK